MKRVAFVVLVVAALLLGLVGCEEDTSGAMAGTWSLDSTEDVAGVRVLGDGDFTLTYVSSQSIPLLGTVEIYSGSGTIGGFDYLAEAMYMPDWQMTSIAFYEPGDTGEYDYIDLEDMSYSGGDFLDGDYAGGYDTDAGEGGVYYTGKLKDIGSGTFTATR